MKCYDKGIQQIKYIFNSCDIQNVAYVWIIGAWGRSSMVEDGKFRERKVEAKGVKVFSCGDMGVQCMMCDNAKI